MKLFAMGVLCLILGMLVGSVLEVPTYGLKARVAPLLVGTPLAVGAASAPEAASEEKKILYWVAPMDPNYRRDKPGQSPMGMDLIPVYAGAGDGADDAIVRIAPNVVNNMGVRTAEAAHRDMERRVDTVGYVGLDETEISHIHLRTDGWVEQLRVKSEGEHVENGQLLFRYYSPTLVNAQEEFLQAVTLKNKRLVSASKLRLVSLGMSEAQVQRVKKTKKPSQLVSVYAPQHGVVSHLSIREGMRVMPAMEIMTLANMRSVWMQTAVFERQASWIALGGRAEARLAYLPGEVWKGTVDFIYPTLDPTTRTLKVRLQFDTPDKRMKPNMYARVSIFAEPKKGALTIPREAVIRSGRGERVVLALGEGRFKSRAIRAGMESAGLVEVLSGLEAGERVVTSAQFLIDSQASLKGSLDRMEPPASQQAAGQEEQDQDTDGTVGTVETTSGQDHTAHETKTPTIPGKGILRQSMPEARKVKLSHDPIPELKWPSMTMDFVLAPGVEVLKIAPGQAVSFRLKKTGEFEYEITELQAIAGGHDHD